MHEPFLPQLHSLELDHTGEKEVQFPLADMERAKNLMGVAFIFHKPQT